MLGFHHPFSDKLFLDKLMVWIPNHMGVSGHIPRLSTMTWPFFLFFGHMSFLISILPHPWTLDMGSPWDNHLGWCLLYKPPWATDVSCRYLWGDPYQEDCQQAQKRPCKFCPMQHLDNVGRFFFFLKSNMWLGADSFSDVPSEGCCASGLPSTHKNLPPLLGTEPIFGHSSLAHDFCATEKTLKILQTSCMFVKVRGTQVSVFSLEKQLHF